MFTTPASPPAPPKTRYQADLSTRIAAFSPAKPPAAEVKHGLMPRVEPRREFRPSGEMTGRFCGADKALTPACPAEDPCEGGNYTRVCEGVRNAVGTHMMPVGFTAGIRAALPATTHNCRDTTNTSEISPACPYPHGYSPSSRHKTNAHLHHCRTEAQGQAPRLLF